ncbi:hypothetical protein R1sor_000232 [Riccia sorocarpa]|uniref:SAM domain-containing protein n=1 Tax=Riccia sorocarpa TaxID=122646 RepID=A0ABD3GVR5_9MARC
MGVKLFDKDGSVQATVDWVASFLGCSDYSVVLADEAVNGSALRHLAKDITGLKLIGFKSGHVANLLDYFEQLDVHQGAATSSPTPDAVPLTPTADPLAGTTPHTHHRGSEPDCSRKNLHHPEPVLFFALLANKPCTCSSSSPTMSTSEDDERVSVKSANTNSRNVSGRDDDHPPAHPLSTRTSNLSEDEPDMMSIIMKGGKFGLYALKDRPTIQHLQMRDCGTTPDTAVESVDFIGFGEPTKVCQNTPYKAYEVRVTDLVKGYNKRFSKCYVLHIGNTTGEPLHVHQLDIISTQAGRHFDSKYLSRQYYSLHVIQNFLGVDEVPTMTNTIDLSQGCMIDYAQCYVTVIEEDDVFARLMKMEWTAKPSNTAGGAAEVAPKNKNKETEELMNTTSLEKECESNHFAEDSHKGQTTLQAFKRRVLAPKNIDNLGEDSTPAPADSCGKTTDDGKRRSARGKGDAESTKCVSAVVLTNSESRSGQQPTKSTSGVDLHEVGVSRLTTATQAIMTVRKTWEHLRLMLEPMFLNQDTSTNA